MDDGGDDHLRRLNRAWMTAYTQGDVAALERMIADDYVGTFPDGSVLDKRAEIEGVRSGKVRILSMEPEEMDVRRYDRTAVITGRSHIRASIEGQDMEGRFRFTDVWIEFPHGWRAVASQVTRIA